MSTDFYPRLIIVLKTITRDFIFYDISIYIYIYNMFVNLSFQEEDEECRIFAAAKRKMTKLRIEKEREIHR